MICRTHMTVSVNMDSVLEAQLSLMTFLIDQAPYPSHSPSHFFTQRQENNLILESGGHRFTGYDESVNPNVLNAFAGAAYRFGHSMIQNNLNRFGVSPQNREFDTIELKEHFGNPTPVYDVCNGGVDAIFRGLVRDPAQTVDRLVATYSRQDNFIGASCKR